MIGANFARRKGILEDTSSTVKMAIPSVSSLQVAMTVGKSDGDAYKSAIDKIYTALRTGNTGSVPYTKLDVQYYFLNLRIGLALDRYLRRAYGVIKKFDLFDKTLPTSIFKAMGLDYDSFAANAANLRQELNFLATKLHTLVPGKNDLLERTAWMFDHIFKDSDDRKAQLYLFALDPYQPFYDWSNSTIAELTPLTNIVNYANTAIGTGLDYTTAITNYRNFISSIVASDKVQLIAADIIKVFGTEQLHYFELLDENYSIDYVYNEEVLTEIQNARIVGGSRSTTAVQDTRIETVVSGNYLVSDAYFAGGTDPDGIIATYAPKSYINFYKDSISNLELICATRFTWTAHPDTNVTGRFILDSFGTEIVTQWNIIDNDILGGGYAYDLYLFAISTFMSNATTSSLAIAQMQLRYAAFSMFDWAPMLIPTYTTHYNSSGTSTEYSTGIPVWDFNNYALVEPNQLTTFNDVAIMSMLYYPSAIKKVNVLTIK